MENNKPTSATWIPTEAELVSLGFELDGNDTVNVAKKGLLEVRLWNRSKMYSGETIQIFFGIESIYPKSLEELKTIISVMNP